MKELVKIQLNESQEPVISGRELHEFLEVGTPYRKWFPRMVEYGFAEKIDYTPDIFVHPQNSQETMDHLLNLDMAKEICMIQRSDKGKQARQYFIQIEKEFNSPEKVMARALRIAEKELSSLRLEVKEMRPKALFADAVSTSDTSILIGDFAKILRQNGIDIGQKRLFKRLRDEGFLIKSGESKNIPTQRAMDMGLFAIKEGSYIDSNDNNIITRTTKVTGKGQLYFINRYLEDSYK